MTIGTTGILRILVVRWTSRFVGSHAMIDTVAGQTQLVYTSEFQQPRIRGAMRCMAGRASLGL